MDAIVQALLFWIASNSQHSVDNIKPPEIVFMSAAQITSEYYAAHRELIPDNGIDERIWALYDAETTSSGTIYLRVDEFKAREKVTTSTALRGTTFIQAPNSDNSLASMHQNTASNAQLLEDNPILTERLLHELVHHVQFQTGANKSYPCQAFGEKEAYLLGQRYFKQRHIEDPFPNRMFWAHVYSRC